MEICDKSFEEELRLVHEAQENERGEAALRNYLLPLVQSVADKYVARDKQHEALIYAGLNHLNLGMERYLERIDEIQEKGEEVYKFSTYFTWFIRQDIVAYLQGNDN